MQEQDEQGKLTAMKIDMSMNKILIEKAMNRTLISMNEIVIEKAMNTNTYENEWINEHHRDRHGNFGAGPAPFFPPGSRRMMG